MGLDYFEGGIKVQITFDARVSVRDYMHAGVEFGFPTLSRCPNSKCKHPQLHKHGFYWRNCFDGKTFWYIPIRRYYCPYCRLTISFLPTFCLPMFQYSTTVIMMCLIERFCNKLSLQKIQKEVFGDNPTCSISRISEYIKRFTSNLPWLEVILREGKPYCLLAPPGASNKKRAKKVLDIIGNGFDQNPSFFKLFHDQCHRSFLAPSH